MRKLFWMGILASVALIGSLNAQTAPMKNTTFTLSEDEPLSQGASCIGCFDTIARHCVASCPENLPNCYCRLGLCCSDDPPVNGTPNAWYSRPDPRDCVYPFCGGDFLFEPPRTPLDTCLDDLTFVQYVTGIFVREDDGTLTRIYPNCYQALTGTIEPDPHYPGFEILIYLPYVL